LLRTRQGFSTILHIGTSCLFQDTESRMNKRFKVEEGKKAPMWLSYNFLVG
jgi:hypothetical protein